jgi:biopolymer transport protein ExbD
MPRRRRGEPQRLDLNLTPLLDVILQLITFFMMLVHVSSKIEASEQIIRLPVAPAGLPTGVLGDDRLIVTIDATGALLPGPGAPLAADAATDWWAEQAQLRKEGLAALTDDPGMLAELPTRVLVRADRDAPYGSVRSALSSAQASGFARFSLVVLRSED